MKKMTENEIIERLEALVKNGFPFCADALNLIKHLKELDKKNENIIRLANKTIESQSAEMERYLHSIKLLEKDVADARAELNEFKKLYVEQIASMAIKEFSEKYEKAIHPMLTSATLEKKEVIHSCLDTLKEMVGDDNA